LQRRGEEENTSQKDTVENAVDRKYVFAGLSGLPYVDALAGNAGIISHASFFPPVSITKYCSCESIIPTYTRQSRQQTMRWLNKTSSKVTLESRYKVSRCATISGMVLLL